MINTAASAQTKNIAERKYWLDGNITQAQDLTVGHATIDISSLEPGLHSLSVRVQDTEGLWSSQVAKYFIKPFANNSESPNGIAQHQYWIDGPADGDYFWVEAPTYRYLLVDSWSPHVYRACEGQHWSVEFTGGKMLHRSI